jgi:hypothetical protein
MTALGVRKPVAWLPHWLAIALFVVAAIPAAFAEEPIVVRIDQAGLFKLPDRATTIVIGNPLIADVSIEPGGLAVLTGKSFGATNIIVMDRTGAVLADHTVEVQGPGDRTIVVYRGVLQETYSCTPYCSPRITLGDDSNYFNQAINASSTRNTSSLAAGAGAPH